MRYLFIAGFVLLLVAAVDRISSPIVYSRTQVALTDLRTLRAAVDSWKQRESKLPDEVAGLGVLTAQPQLLEKLPVDPWGHEYVYRRVANTAGYVVYSRGKDGVDSRGDGDDITDLTKSYPCESGMRCEFTRVDWLVLVAAGAFAAGAIALSLRLIRRVQQGAA